MSKVAIVTGAAGFLGYHLCVRLKKEGFTVVGIDNVCTGSRSNFVDLKKMGIDCVEADVSTPWGAWFPKIDRAEYLFHFASPASPPLYQAMMLKTMAVNSLGLYNALEKATELKARLIFASTSEVYGSPKVSPQPETYWGYTNSFGPRACYDESKRFGEALIYSYNLEKKTSHGLVRIFNTYGPRMNPNDGRVIINFLVQMKKGEDLTLHGDGSQTRSFCYVDDLIEGIWRYAQKKTLAQPVNIGSQFEFSIAQLAEKVIQMNAKKLKVIQIARPIDDPPQRCPDLTLAKKELDWEPKITLEDGLKRTFESLST